VRLKKLRYWIGAIIGLALLVWVLRKFNLGQMWQAVQSADYVWLLPAGIAMLVMFALRAVRWKLLLGPLGNVKFPVLWSGVLIGYLGNFALTANAGELIRAFVLGQREGLSKTAVLASIVVEKLLDIIVLVGFLLALSITLPLPRWIKTMIALAGLLFGVACLILILLPRYETRATVWLNALGKRISILPTSRIERLLHSFITGIQVWRQGQAMIWAVVLSCLIWPVLAIAFFFISRALNLTVAWPAYLLLVALITLGAIVPSLPGQAGALELLVIGGLAVFAVDMEQALTFALLLRLVRLLPLSLGYISLLRAGLSLSDARSIQMQSLRTAGEARQSPL
jgi:uncharacterized protein (TIRG00374 family)